MNGAPTMHHNFEAGTPPPLALARRGEPATVPRQAPEARKLRLLVFTSLYPNAIRPRHGVFVEERLRQLVASGRIDASVVAPVPWFPFARPRFGGYGEFARVPALEERHGIRVEHPRYPVIPKVGMTAAAALLYHALLPVLRRRLARGADFDAIDAHYFYPDGVAAVRLGDALGKPVVVTARGSDVTMIPGHPSPRRQIERAARHAAAIITVSQALHDRLLALGIDASKITTLRNGVDLDRFRPLDRHAARAALRVTGPTWLTVGNLIELKGVHIAIQALAQTAGATLLVVGDGPELPRLRRLAATLGVATRVRFLGAIAHEELYRYYNAADALLHPSSREGMPNAVLESLACGTPVIAAPFEGATELLSAPAAGAVATTRSGTAIAAAWGHLQNRMPTRSDTRAFAERLGWDTVIEAQVALYDRVIANAAQAAARP
jgi:glycosyltransferase involved in cell wall biosynthesis